MTVWSKTRAWVAPRFRRFELTGFFVLIAILFIRRFDYVGFFADEADWIHSSFLFDALVQGDFSERTWGINYWTVDQPDLTRYLIGIGRLIGQPGPLNTRWDYSVSDAVNQANGAMPSPALLWWARLPMALLAALSGVLVMEWVSRAAGRLAGYIWLSFFALSLYITYTLCRAMAESPLLAAVALAGLAGTFGLHNLFNAFAGTMLDWRALRRSLWWLSLMGLSSGLAASAKLNGVTIVFAGVLGCGAIAITAGKALPATRRWLLCVGAALLLLGVTAVTFVLLNPFLYADPVGRSMLMLTHRTETIQRQQVTFAADRIDSWSERIQIVPLMVFEKLAVRQFPGVFWINLILSGLAVIVLGWTIYRLRLGELSAVASFMLLAMALTGAAPSWFTPFTWDRYFILPVVFVMILSAIALAKLITQSYLYMRSHWATIKQPVSQA